MTSVELISLGLSVHSGSLLLSLPAVYAVFGDKFVMPSLQRATEICAKLRGRLAAELEQKLSCVFGDDEKPTTARAILDATGNPAKITYSEPFGGERFRDALRTFLDSESDDFCRYHSAMRARQIMLRCWSNVRVLSAVWPLFALLGTVVFGAFTNNVLAVPGQKWLWAVAVFLIVPFVLVLLHLPVLALATKRIESLEPKNFTL